jgi:hypothetical protein
MRTLAPPPRLLHCFRREPETPYKRTLVGQPGGSGAAVPVANLNESMPSVVGFDLTVVHASKGTPVTRVHSVGHGQGYLWRSVLNPGRPSLGAEALPVGL